MSDANYAKKKSVANHSCFTVENKHILKRLEMELNYIVIVIITVIGISIPMCIVCCLLCYLLKPKEFLTLTPSETPMKVIKRYFFEDKGYVKLFFYSYKRKLLLNEHYIRIKRNETLN